MSQLTRRNLLKMLGVSAAGTVAACNSQGPENILPYVIPDDNFIVGDPVFYRTVCNECPAACGVTARNLNGRVSKLEGNDLDNHTAGKLCARGHSSLQLTYNVDRLLAPEIDRNRKVSWAKAMKWIASKAQGKVVVLSSSQTGTQARLLAAVAAAAKEGQWLAWDAGQSDMALRAGELLYGKRLVARADLSQADLIVSIDAAFLETWQNPVAATRQFAEAKKQDDYKGSVYIGARYSLTASNCDSWIANKSGTSGSLAMALLKLVADRKGVRAKVDTFLTGADAVKLATEAEVAPSRLAAIATALLAASRPVVICGSDENGGENAHIAVTLLNEILGATGTRVFVGDNLAFDTQATTREVRDTLNSLGKNDLLLVADCDPMYAFGIKSAAPVVALSTAINETTEIASLTLPINSPIESWGDAEPVAGQVKILQPAMAPLKKYDSRTLNDVLIQLITALGGKSEAAEGQAAVRAAWQTVQQPVGDNLQVTESWYAALQVGGYGYEVSAQPLDLNVPAAVASQPVSGDLIVEVYPSLKFYDGRVSDRPWLHELPDPITTLVWDGWVEVHPETAKKLKAEDGDLLTIKTAAGSVSLPVKTHPGQRQELLAVPSGLGKSTGTYTANVGANGYKLLDGHGNIAVASVQVKKQPSELVVIQPQTSQYDRGIAQVITAAELLHPTDNNEEPPEAEINMYPVFESPIHRWGLAIDLDSCTGCGSCVTACDSENNVAIVGIQTNFPRKGKGTTAVGKQLLREGREMHWIRIERFYEPGEDGRTDIRYTPAMCAQCTTAPCETVCPVYATMHTQDGLNAMVYNRCVGTRYCSNNCPYKQRRFNWMTYDWPKEYDGLLNPEITVRTKGVMEKCTFCVQRIKRIRLDARMNDRDVQDGEIVTACQQTCPADAIVFGDLKDPKSRVSKLSGQHDTYRIFEELNTQPAVHYLKAVIRKPLEA